MRIYRGKMVSKGFIPTLLEAVPEEDLKELKSIHVKLKPGNGFEKSFGGVYQPSKKRVSIFAQNHWFKAEHEFSKLKDDLHRLFTEYFAKTLYHEVGHHWDNTSCSDSGYFDLEYNPNTRNEAYEMVELVAKNYANEKMSIAQETGLFDKLNFSDTPYAYAMYKKLLDNRMKTIKKHGYRGANTTAIFNILRKKKLGPEAKYSPPQIYDKLYQKYYENWEDNRRRFKEFTLKHTEPLWYTSPKGYKYPYYTQENLETLIKIKDRFKPKTKKLKSPKVHEPG